MNNQTDSQLLCAYVERRSEPAFAELVRRHIDLVYSAALRMVCDTHLAEDVTQGVFVALAKNAGQLADRPVLSGWLHRTAQNISAQTVRTDVRRRRREQEAVAMNELLTTAPDASWDEIGPNLDAALGELSEPDRDAVLLRYFQKKSAAEIASVLGVSDEAAQKRVNRAVERLREFFAKRGIAVGAGGLVVVISTNAVQAAPVGLAAAISTAAVLTGSTIGVATAVTKTVAMTTLQKTIVTATIAALAGVGIFEVREAAKLRKQVETFQRQQGPLSEAIQQLQGDKSELASRLSVLAAELARHDANSKELLKLRGEVARLRNENDNLARSVREAQAFETDMMRMISNLPPVRTYVANAVASLAWDQALVTGGWKISPGKRVVTLVAVQPLGDTGQLTISSKILQYDENTAAHLGLEEFNTNERETDGSSVRAKTQTITAKQLESLLQAARDTAGSELLAAPAVTTLSGRQAQVQTVDIHTLPSGEKYSTGPVLDFIPTIAPDGKSVQMILSAQMNVSVRTPNN